jgi:hypothetical protein
MALKYAFIHSGTGPIYGQKENSCFSNDIFFSNFTRNGSIPACRLNLKRSTVLVRGAAQPSIALRTENMKPSKIAPLLFVKVCYYFFA